MHRALSLEKRDLPVGSALIGAVVSHSIIGIAAWRDRLGAALKVAKRSLGGVTASDIITFLNCYSCRRRLSRLFRFSKLPVLLIFPFLFRLCVLHSLKVPSRSFFLYDYITIQ